MICNVRPFILFTAVFPFCVGIAFSQNEIAVSIPKAKFTPTTVKGDSVILKIIGRTIWNTNTPKSLVCSCGPFHYPLLVLVTNRNKYVIDSVDLAKIKPKWVANLIVNPDTVGYNRYGSSAKYGVLMIILKNNFYSTILDSLKMHLKKIN